MGDGMAMLLFFLLAAIAWEADHMPPCRGVIVIALSGEHLVACVAEAK